jgi:hypothetical protein
MIFILQLQGRKKHVKKWAFNPSQGLELQAKHWDFPNSTRYLTFKCAQIYEQIYSCFFSQWGMFHLVPFIGATSQIMEFMYVEFMCASGQLVFLISILCSKTS